MYERGDTVDAQLRKLEVILLIDSDRPIYAWDSENERAFQRLFTCLEIDEKHLSEYEAALRTALQETNEACARDLFHYPYRYAARIGLSKAR